MSNSATTKLIEELDDTENSLSENDLLMTSVREGSDYVSKKMRLGTLANYVRSNSSGNYTNLAIGTNTKKLAIVRYRISTSSNPITAEWDNEMPTILKNQITPSDFAKKNDSGTYVDSNKVNPWWWEGAPGDDYQKIPFKDGVIDNSNSSLCWHTIPHDGILYVSVDTNPHYRKIKTIDVTENSSNTTESVINAMEYYRNSAVYLMMKDAYNNTAYLIKLDNDNPGQQINVHFPVQAGAQVQFRVHASRGQYADFKELYMALFYNEDSASSGDEVIEDESDDSANT